MVFKVGVNTLVRVKDTLCDMTNIHNLIAFFLLNFTESALNLLMVYEDQITSKMTV